MLSQIRSRPNILRWGHYLVTIKIKKLERFKNYVKCRPKILKRGGHYLITEISMFGFRKIRYLYSYSPNQFLFKIILSYYILKINIPYKININFIYY